MKPQHHLIRLVAVLAAGFSTTATAAPPARPNLVFLLAVDSLDTRNLSQDPAAAPDMETMRRKFDRQRIELGPHRVWECPAEK